jgi:galactokinase/mevalonate kinase-like predicted kinase
MSEAQAPERRATTDRLAQRIVYSAPGRCGIVGNPSDMYGGSVISLSTVDRAYVSLEPSDRLILEADEGPVEIRRRTDLALKSDHCDILRAVIAHQRLHDLRCHIRCWSDLPFGAGLSGSTAMLAAALAAVSEHRGQQYNSYHFAELARAIELNHMGVVCGYQDQYMATFGGMNFLDFRDKEFYREVFSEPYATVEPLSERGVAIPPVVLAHTGVQHLSGAVHKPIRERWLEGEREVVEAYVAVARLARDAKKALLWQDWRRLGELMTDNHAIQRGLGGSGPENERLIEAALGAGALGAKLAGAGNGGTIIALHPEPRSLEDALLAAGATRIMYPRPSPGLRREPPETRPPS